MTNLLQTGLAGIIEKTHLPFSPIRDEYGVYCYLTKQYAGKWAVNGFVFAAKKYVWNGQVSVHRRIWDHCYKNNRPLVLYIASPKGYLFFEVGKISKFYENQRNGVTMINFSSGEGIPM